MRGSKRLKMSGESSKGFGCFPRVKGTPKRLAILTSWLENNLGDEFHHQLKGAKINYGTIEIGESLSLTRSPIQFTTEANRTSKALLNGLLPIRLAENMDDFFSRMSFFLHG